MKNHKNMKVLSGLFASFVFSSLLFTSCKKGDEGPIGTAGANGAAGANGTTGANGANGANGNSILSGEGAPSATLGTTGDFYLDTRVTAFYGPKTASGWGSPVSLAGTPGPVGASGASGATPTVDTFSIYTDNWLLDDEKVYVQSSNDVFTTFPARYADRLLPDLTQDILDHGMVLVSFTPSLANEPGQWLPIPYIIPGVDPNNLKVNYNWSYVTGDHTIRMQFYLTPASSITYIPASIQTPSPVSGSSTETTSRKITTGAPAGPDLEDFTVPDARYKVVIIPATVTEEIAAITKKQFTSTGKVLSNN
jgi:hypothetical protein